MVGWKPLTSDKVKLNVDGAVMRSTGRAGCGGVLRDHSGGWMAGFSHSLGSCDVFVAEEWAILKGLTIAWDLGVRCLTIESDSKDLIELLNYNPQARNTLTFWKIQEL